MWFIVCFVGDLPWCSLPNRLAVIECTSLTHCLAFSSVLFCVLSLFALISFDFFVFFVCECCRFLHVYVAAFSCMFYYLLNHSSSYENKCCMFQGEYVYCCVSHSLHKIILVVVFFNAQFIPYHQGHFWRLIKFIWSTSNTNVFRAVTYLLIVD